MFGQGSPFSIKHRNSFDRVFQIFTISVLLCCCAPIAFGQNRLLPRRSSPDPVPTRQLENSKRTRDVDSQTRPLNTSSDSVSDGRLNEASPFDDSAISGAQPRMISPTPVSDNRATGKDAIRFRLSWGGGEAKKWAGSISLTQGTLSNVQPLSLTADAAGSVVLANQKLHVNHWTATNYGGADVWLTNAVGGSLKIELHATEEPDEKLVREIEISALLAQPFQHDLVGAGNRFVIGRAPGDALPVTFNREHLVFSPGEVFEIGVQANRTELASQSANCRLRLSPANSSRGSTKLLNGTAEWKKSLSMELDSNGSAAPQRVEIPLPMEEGVYDLEIELAPTWQQASLRNKSSITRNVQLIVIDNKPISAAETKPWRLLTTIDPTQSASDLTASINQLSKFTGMSSPETKGNDLRRTVTVEKQSMLELAPGGWQAIPIPVDRIDHPQMIEIEFLADQPAAIGISLLQPDLSGQIPLYGFDTGVMVPRSLIDIHGTTGGKVRQIHRVVCWPQHKQPYLLIANRHARQNATIGNIRVLAGPDRLPLERAAAAVERRVQNRNPAMSRQFMAFFESPLFPESFAAHETVDPAVGQPLDDWQTFYIGADRFIQHLKANSYSGAFIAVVSDGSSIYPSRILGASPKHDTGIFFSNGQDPIRKDVLEMLFRMFQREGLVLVPTLSLSGPLPELESQRLSIDPVNGRADLVHFNQTRSSRSLKNHLPIYNPLDRDVQKNVRDIVRELSQRYRSFESYRGLAMICRPDTYTLLPGTQWSYDRSTMNEFWRSQPTLGRLPDDWTEIQDVLLNHQRENWIQWRAQQMSALYQSLLATMRESTPAGELYIAPLDLYRSEDFSSALMPSLHSSVDFPRQMLHLGLDANSFAQTKGLHLLKPRRLAPNESLATNRVESGLENNRQVDDFYLQAQSIGDVYGHRISWAHFAQLESDSPFGLQTSPLMRLQPLTPAGAWNRQRFLQSLRISDSKLFVDGGWLISLGEDAALADMVATFRQLPNQNFAPVQLPEKLTKFASSTMPVVVRSADVNGKTWFYAVNASPWPVSVQLTLSNPSTGNKIPKIRSLSSQPLSVVQANAGPQVQFQMEPLSLVGCVSDKPMAIRDYQFQLPENAADRLRKHVYALQAKLVKSSDVQSLPVLKNSDFESYGQPTLVGWDFGQQSTEKIQLVSKDAYRGNVSLKMSNDSPAPVWVRSNSIETPNTGRLSVSVWLRTDSPNTQPPLRMAIEGTLESTSYYRFGTVGSLSPDRQANQIGERWQRFAVHFDDLPTERLTNLRIGFDLMGPGEVQIDNVEVYDRWFDERDATAITQRLAGCGPMLANSMTLESCRLLLNSYWLRFLDEHFDDPAIVVIPVSPKTGPDSDPSGNQESASDDDSNSKSFFRRFRRLGGSRNSNMR